jgi:hypothetical protein
LETSSRITFEGFWKIRFDIVAGGFYPDCVDTRSDHGKNRAFFPFFLGIIVYFIHSRTDFGCALLGRLRRACVYYMCAVGSKKMEKQQNT